MLLAWIFTVEPTPIMAYCNAILYRFASSERGYLLRLQVQIKEIMGECISLRDDAGHGIPVGDLDSQPIICNLLDVFIFKGL